MAQAVAKDASDRRATSLVHHDHDLLAWVEEQVMLLKAGRFDDIDLENVAAELSDVGKNLHWRLWSTLRVLIMHMLKWDQQPEKRTQSWVYSIREQRRRYAKLMKTSPSLKSHRDDALTEVYPVARDWASLETHVPEDEFPTDCPYGWDDLLDRPFEMDP